MYNFEVGEIYTTRGGDKVRILAKHTEQAQVYLGEYFNTRKKAWFPCSWDASGLKHGTEVVSPYDIMPPEPYVYINVYEDEDGSLRLSPNSWDSRSSADDAGCGRLRVGCIKVKVEARFDD